MKAIFLDIETTGLDPLRHVPIDIALKIYDVASGQVITSYQSVILQPRALWDLHDPVSLEINGYRWDDIVNGKEPERVKEEIIDTFNSNGIQRGKAVFICQNPAFDRSFFIRLIDVYTQEKLNWPYHWLDLASMYWALLSQQHSADKTPFPDTLCLSKNAIAKLYNIPEEAHPHRAMQGVDHLIACYQAVLVEGGAFSREPQLVKNNH